MSTPALKIAPKSITVRSDPLSHPVEDPVPTATVLAAQHQIETSSPVKHRLSHAISIEIVELPRVSANETGALLAANQLQTDPRAPVAAPISAPPALVRAAGSDRASKDRQEEAREAASAPAEAASPDPAPPADPATNAGPKPHDLIAILQIAMRPHIYTVADRV